MAMITITALFLVLLGQLTAGVPIKDHYAAIATGPRIVGGVPAPENSAPYMMAIVFGQWVISLICGANIVSKKHALTAAHCVDPLLTWDQQLSPTTRGVYGSNRWNSTTNQVRFAHHVNHPDWDPRNIKNDLAVLCIHEDDIITMSDKVAPIPMGLDYIGGGVDCHVTGWGRLSNGGDIPDYLQYIKLRTIDEQTCTKGLSEAAGSLWLPPVDYRIEMCTLHPQGVGYGACNGDSGSALVSNGRIVGMVSWGIACANGFPDIHVRLSPYGDWLHKNMN